MPCFCNQLDGCRKQGRGTEADKTSKNSIENYLSSKGHNKSLLKYSKTGRYSFMNNYDKDGNKIKNEVKNDLDEFKSFD